MRLHVPHGAVLRRRQSPMRASIIVQKFRYSRQGGFDLITVGAPSCKRHEANSSGEFVIDPMLELVQQDVLARQRPLTGEDSHDFLLMTEGRAM